MSAVLRDRKNESLTLAYVLGGAAGAQLQRHFSRHFSSLLVMFSKPKKVINFQSLQETAALLDRNNETPTLERILREERLVRDRNTILLSHKKNFSGILAMLSKPKDDPKRRGEGANGKAHPAPDSGGRYANGKETEQFWKGYVQGGDVADLGINTTATSDRWAEESGSAQAGKAAEQARQATRQKLVKKIDGPPIIIVPNAANTLLNIYNAKDFLENGNYVKWDEKASLSSLKPTNVGVMRNINRKEPYPHYQILNVAPKAGSKDWQRVVAVFVIGKLWQFNGWPWSDISEIFNNVKGFHLRYEDEKLDDVIKSWNVKSISLSKFNRHRDKTAALEFWNQLDRFLGAQKKGLTY